MSIKGVINILWLIFYYYLKSVFICAKLSIQLHVQTDAKINIKCITLFNDVRTIERYEYGDSIIMYKVNYGKN